MSSQYETSTGFTTATTSAAEVASATIDWGTRTNYQDVVVYTVDKGEDTLGTINDYSSFCASKGKGYIASATWPGPNGKSYSSYDTSYACFTTAKNYFDNTVKSSMSEVTYNNLLILQGSSPVCWAHNAEDGSMHAFGGPTGSGFSFCRGGGEASKRFHMYICK